MGTPHLKSRKSAKNSATGSVLAVWQAVESTSSSFQEARAAMTAQAGPLKDAIVDVLVDRCLTVLRQLRGISATYRMTAR